MIDFGKRSGAYLKIQVVNSSKFWICSNHQSVPQIEIFSFLELIKRRAAHFPHREMFSILESVAFDTGYAGSAGLVPQSWVNGNGTSYIYFGAGEFDGQGSGHDYLGTVCSGIGADA